MSDHTSRMLAEATERAEIAERKLVHATDRLKLAEKCLFKDAVRETVELRRYLADDGAISLRLADGCRDRIRVLVTGLYYLLPNAEADAGAQDRIRERIEQAADEGVAVKS